MFESGVLEVGMLVCFAVAWPVSIVRSLRSRTAKGKSVWFAIIVIIGYVLGIANKIFTGQMNYVLAFYIFNLALVAVDMCVWFRNNRLDREEATKREGTI